MPILGVVHGTKIGPNAPTVTGVTDVGLNREFDNGAVDVAFTPAAVNTAVSYKVTSSNGQVATGSSSPIRVQNLPTGINTTFTVTGINDITIEGPPSAVSSGVVVTTVPTRPTIGVATAGNGVAYVVFTISNSGGKQVISYLATGSPAGSGTDTASPITVSTLDNGIPHAFTITAVNANGPSLPSNPSNIVTPSTSGGSGVPAGTFYCYSSDCFTSDGSNFAYLQAPIFTAVSPSDQSSLTNYSAGFGFARGTRVTYCNTVEATAAIGAQQSVCQANYVPPIPPPPCDPTEYTSECGPYTAQPRVDGCSSTSADYGYTITETATRTRTTYDCNGIILTTAVLTCTRSTFTTTTSNDVRCPGYRAPVVNYQPVTSTQTGAVARPTGADPVITPLGGDSTAYWSTVTNTDGSTTSVIIENGVQVGEPITFPPVGPDGTWFTFDWSQTDWSGLGGGFDINIDYDALADLNNSYAQPSVPAAEASPGSVPYNTGPDSFGGGGCFLFGTKITMADGSFKNIEDLKLGDELRTFDIPGVPDSDQPEDWYTKDKWSVDNSDEFTYTTTKVSHVRSGPYNEYYTINNKYKVTWEHYILVKRDAVWQFLQTQDLKTGDVLMGEKKEEIEIFNIERTRAWISTVELDVEDKDFYFADGILAHNLRAPVDKSYVI
jgi:hypothetical protein